MGIWFPSLLFLSLTTGQYEISSGIIPFQTEQECREFLGGKETRGFVGRAEANNFSFVIGDCFEHQIPGKTE